jgi:RCR-type E3 ubiquitin transferase
MFWRNNHWSFNIFLLVDFYAVLLCCFFNQALNWLLHEVSRPSCLHDLLWWFVIALSAEVRTVDGTNDSTDPRCRHPLSDLYLAGESVKPLPQVFYQFLQTVSDLMLYLPAGSALQMMAVRCWDINFTASDHMFLHR